MVWCWYVHMSCRTKVCNTIIVLLQTLPSCECIKYCSQWFSCYRRIKDLERICTIQRCRCIIYLEQLLSCIRINNFYHRHMRIEFSTYTVIVAICCIDRNCSIERINKPYFISSRIIQSDAIIKRIATTSHDSLSNANREQANIYVVLFSSECLSDDTSYTLKSYQSTINISVHPCNDATTICSCSIDCIDLNSRNIYRESNRGSRKVIIKVNSTNGIYLCCISSEE